MKKRDHTGAIDADEMIMQPPTKKIRTDCVGVVTPSFTLSPSTSKVPISASTLFDFPVFKSTISSTGVQDDAKFATKIQEATSSLDDEPVWDDMSDIEESSSFRAQPSIVTGKSPSRKISPTMYLDAGSPTTTQRKIRRNCHLKPQRMRRFHLGILQTSLKIVRNSRRNPSFKIDQVQRSHHFCRKIQIFAHQSTNS